MISLQVQARGERAALLLATVAIGIGVATTPSMDACHLGVLGAALTIAILHVTRLLGPRGSSIERPVLALFLGGMPVIYLLSGVQTGVGTSGLEWFGFLMFGALAALGYWSSPWYLAIGIAAHGLCWDAWHLYAKISPVPEWYARGCLFADLGLAFYVVSRIPFLQWQKGSAQGVPVTLETAVHYVWGERCDGWHFLNTQGMSLILEKMPPGTSERRHKHRWSRQFFLILTGAAEIEIDGKVHFIGPKQGIEVPPGTPHRIFNPGSEALEFFLASSPRAHGDRQNLDEPAKGQ